MFLLVVVTGTATGGLQPPATAFGSNRALRTFFRPSGTIAYRRPAAFFFGNHFGMRRLHWRRWGTASTTARGYTWADDCMPNCAQGRLVPRRARIRLWRPVPLGRRWFYTRGLVVDARGRYSYHFPVRSVVG